MNDKQRWQYYNNDLGMWLDTNLPSVCHRIQKPRIKAAWVANCCDLKVTGFIVLPGFSTIYNNDLGMGLAN